MRLLLLTLALVGLGILAAVAPASAAPLDGSVPILCAVNAVMDCPRKGGCEQSTPEEAEVPPFVKIVASQKMLISVDGARSSPITALQRNNGRLMIQGMQNERVWGAVIDEQSGRMTATVGEDDGAIVISGTCIVP